MTSVTTTADGPFMKWNMIGFPRQDHYPFDRNLHVYAIEWWLPITATIEPKKTTYHEMVMVFVEL